MSYKNERIYLSVSSDLSVVTFPWFQLSYATRNALVKLLSTHGAGDSQVMGDSQILHAFFWSSQWHTMNFTFLSFSSSNLIFIITLSILIPVKHWFCMTWFPSKGENYTMRTYGRVISVIVTCNVITIPFNLRKIFELIWGYNKP